MIGVKLLMCRAGDAIFLLGMEFDGSYFAKNKRWKFWGEIAWRKKVCGISFEIFREKSAQMNRSPRKR